MDRRRLDVLALALLLAIAAAAPARAETFVRVITQRARVRTGPGPDFRTMYTAERGAVMAVKERGTKGYWFRVELEDGTTGWIFGEQVFPFEVVEDDDPGALARLGRGIRRAILGPTPLPYADIELSFSAGALAGEGVFLFRPAWIVDPYFAVEAFAGESPRKDETVLVAGLGWTLRLIPGAPVGPYLNAGLGAAHFDPKEDAPTLQAHSTAALSVGGGFEITLKKRITFRLDFRNWTFFDQDEGEHAQEYSGGLAVFF